jgi:Ser/Thr protein kinase RdoA (MazF antagonist)
VGAIPQGLEAGRRDQLRARAVLPEVLVHGDFHPGNVLWRRGVVSRVVDWQAACTGPAVIDVAQCRVNLLTIGTDAAERFTAW